MQRVRTREIQHQIKPGSLYQLCGGEVRSDSGPEVMQAVSGWAVPKSTDAKEL
jgi:hypothetical protein